MKTKISPLYRIIKSDYRYKIQRKAWLGWWEVETINISTIDDAKSIVQYLIKKQRSKVVRIYYNVKMVEPKFNFIKLILIPYFIKFLTIVIITMVAILTIYYLLIIIK